MKLISWNVNGLRACLGKGFGDFFTGAGADIFCIQETKMQQDQSELVLPGYEQYWNSAVKKGYSGTAVFTRLKPLAVTWGLGIEEHDQEGRLITLEFDEFYLVNVYTPNSQRGLLRLEYRLRWESDFRNYLLQLDRNKPVVMCGDLNVAHEEIDIKNPKANRKNAGFTDEERNSMTVLLASGFTDSFRALYPEKRDAYTWWSYMMNARARNIGWRIDYFIVSDRLKDVIAAAHIYPDIMGSDHCPVGLELHPPLSPQ
ncbi:exodeoxyribonuclease III [Sporomusa termitida]|uniref:Exodeoxyribonuclease n=1 Tax=Sporomusa termitida TaxID=2377 RepID=A0A517DYC2_9FIRM|nr:exodeoxyribonuclease III [Sporomusa termitida]QDR82355.1 Exodeoxyribonuclease [Sporomusa termitida]